MYQALVYILEETRMGVGVGKILEGGNFYPKKFQFWYLLPPILIIFTPESTHILESIIHLLCQVSQKNVC